MATNFSAPPASDGILPAVLDRQPVAPADASSQIAAAAFRRAPLMPIVSVLLRLPEEPDVAPAVHTSRWLPRDGRLAADRRGALHRADAVLERPHRVIFTFYVGIGVALAALLLKATSRPSPVAAAEQTAHPKGGPRRRPTSQAAQRVLQRIREETASLRRHSQSDSAACVLNMSATRGSEPAPC